MPEPSCHIDAESEPVLNQSSSALRAGPDGNPDAPPPIVLCVDDERSTLASLKRMLRGSGLRVMTAEGAEGALELMARVPVDLVMSDMRMPGMDGVALLEQIRLHWPGVVRILLTGHSDMAATVSAINRGEVFRYLGKPWDDQEVLIAVHQGLQHGRKERERDRLLALVRPMEEQPTPGDRGLVGPSPDCEQHHASVTTSRLPLQSLKAS